MPVIIKKSGSNDRLTLRISSKDKFSLELLAQKKGLTLSALFLQLIEKPLKAELTITPAGEKNSVYIPDAAYDPLAPDRLVKLAMIAPELLTESEQVIWKVIKEDMDYWKNENPVLKPIRDSWLVIQNEAKNLLEQHSN